MELPLRPLCTVAGMDGKVVVSAEVQEIDFVLRPCCYQGAGKLRGAYIRVGDTDVRMTEYEIYSCDAYRKKTQDELRPAP